MSDSEFKGAMIFAVVLVGLAFLFAYAHGADLNDCFKDSRFHLSCIAKRIYTLLEDGESRTIETIITHLYLNPDEKILASRAVRYMCGNQMICRGKVQDGKEFVWVYWRENIKVAA